MARVGAAALVADSLELFCINLKVEGKIEEFDDLVHDSNDRYAQH